MIGMRFLDTNILLYSISCAAAEDRKRGVAIGLLDQDDWVLSVQVLQEFYVQATRVSRPDPIPHEVAAGLVRTWLRFRVQGITVAVMRGALEIKATHDFSYWDSAIISAARASGCLEIYSEDLSHGREVEGITIFNPFR
ncbi:MAG: PIN domain-containing protein [Magnetococcales bacterium]|nr:PIN domain-containing protein [Magnetococcales bacterium]MBF0321986.1 PIN domain-containing protein [Magnetococcales bacterium]